MTGISKVLRFVAVSLFVLCVSCREMDNEVVTDSVKMNSQSSIYQVEFDGHEYLVYKGFRKGGICHKINCKFCEEEK